MEGGRRDFFLFINVLLNMSINLTFVFSLSLYVFLSAIVPRKGPNFVRPRTANVSAGRTGENK